MFSYIKDQMLKHDAENKLSNSMKNDDSELVVEYAHLFQELEELTVDGTEEDKMRSVSIDIPLEDDIELDSIEFNLSDGRITDVPMDASIQEAEYYSMKTFEDFYQEACETIPRFTRESNASLDDRRMKYASDRYKKYKSYIIQEGLFGFDKINIQSPEVPVDTIIDFGPIKPDKPNDHYYVKLPVYFEVDKKHCLLKKQLESLSVFAERNFYISLAEYIWSDLNNKYDIPKKKTLWDILTPKKINVPRAPIDHFIIYIQFMNDFIDDTCWYSVRLPIKAITKHHGKIDDVIDVKSIADIKPINHNEFKDVAMKNKKEIIKESYIMNKPDRFGRMMIQEAIDFGNGNNVDGGDNATPDNANLDNSSNVSIDDSSAPVAVDDNTNSGVPVDTNNVSEQIAQKVADETNDNASNDTDANIDAADGNQFDEVTDVPEDVDTPSSSEDMNDNTDDMSVDQKLNDLDVSGNTDMSLEPTSDVDIDNMTIEDLLAQGADKLKSMSISDLKNFLNSNNQSSSAVQEAFFLTKKNINNEVNIAIRRVLGVLNDDKMEISELIKEFKSAGKKLNRVLTKAVTMTDVYNDKECIALKNLNKTLVDLMVMLKETSAGSALKSMKKLIKSFTSQCSSVVKMVEKKINAAGTPVTDNTSSKSNILSRANRVNGEKPVRKI
jgi:hypothetical protein